MPIPEQHSAVVELQRMVAQFELSLQRASSRRWRSGNSDSYEGYQVRASLTFLSAGYIGRCSYAEETRAVGTDQRLQRASG